MPGVDDRIAIWVFNLSETELLYYCAALMVLNAAVGGVIGQRKARPLYGLLAGLIAGPIGWCLIAVAKTAKPICPACGAAGEPKFPKCRHCGSDMQPRAVRVLGDIDTIR